MVSVAFAVGFLEGGSFSLSLPLSARERPRTAHSSGRRRWRTRKRRQRQCRWPTRDRRGCILDDLGRATAGGGGSVHAPDGCAARVGNGVAARADTKTCRLRQMYGETRGQHHEIHDDDSGLQFTLTRTNRGRCAVCSCSKSDRRLKDDVLDGKTYAVMPQLTRINAPTVAPVS